MSRPQALDKALGLDHPTDKVKQDTDLVPLCQFFPDRYNGLLFSKVNT